MNKIIQRAKENYKKTTSAWGDTYRKAGEDMFFLSDDPLAQWDSEEYNKRKRTGRPIITVDQLGQFVHQVANSIRQNTPTINVYPSDMNGSEETAEVLKGLIKEIEYYSRADDIYDTASLNSIKCSLGWIRVNHKYEYNSGLQRLCLERVVNPLSVYIDPDSIECDGSDAKFAYVIDKMSAGEFKKKFPKKAVVSFEADEFEECKDDDDKVIVAEYYELIESEEGKNTVKRYLLSGNDILEENDTPFEYIPIVPVYGEEAWVKGKREIYSLIRKAKQAQKRYNYWVSLETELLQKAPKAPVMSAEGQIEEFIDDWTNPDEAVALRYSPTDSQGNLLGAPQRLAPPQIPVGIVNAARQSIDDIKSTMGIYNAALGMQSNETSGIAIRRRQAESDVATYHFSDNLSRSITQVGRILISAIPMIYDTPRVLQIIGEDMEQKRVGVNGALDIEQADTVDLTQGQYNVRVSTGASSTTRRQEAAEFFTQMIQTSPDMIKIMGDLMFNTMDFTGASAMAERIKKIMDPSVFENKQDPVVMQLQQQLQQMQGVMAEMQAQLQEKQQELALKAEQERNDVEESKAKMQLQLEELRLKREESIGELRLKERELAIKEQELQLKALEMQQQTSNYGVML